MLMPGHFVVFTGADFASSNALAPFSLHSLGEEIYLFSGDATTNLTGYVHGFEYGCQKTNVTFGRYVNSVGKESFVAQTANTIGAIQVAGTTQITARMNLDGAMLTSDPVAIMVRDTTAYAECPRRPILAPGR